MSQIPDSRFLHARGRNGYYWDRIADGVEGISGFVRIPCRGTQRA